MKRTTRNGPLRARTLDVSSLHVINGGKPEGGYTVARGTLHGYWSCDFCDAIYATVQRPCPACGGIQV